jgi:undecaprenyl-diphosphatase
MERWIVESWPKLPNPRGQGKAEQADECSDDPTKHGASRSVAPDGKELVGTGQGSHIAVAGAAMLIVTWVILTGLLITLGMVVVHSSSINAFDHRVTTTVAAHRSPGLNAAMKAVTWLGSWVALVITGAIVLVFAIRHRLPWLAVLIAVIAWAGEASAVTIVKHVVQRPRPPRDLWLVTAHGWSWPSGHTATAALVFTVLALAVGHVLRSRFIRMTMWSIAVVAVVAVAFSRIELAVHWTTDVIASIIFVVSWLVALVLSLLTVGLHDRPPPGGGSIVTNGQSSEPG